MKIKTETALFSLALAGCASVPNIEMQHASASSIKRIALLKTPPPQNVLVMNMGGGAMAFGAVGGLIQGGVNADHSKQFAAVLAKYPALSETVMTEVERSLKAKATTTRPSTLTPTQSFPFGSALWGTFPEVFPCIMSRRCS